jgi:hypothetical protein
LVTNDIELQVIVVGLDETTMQMVHAKFTYYPNNIVWGARLRDVLSDGVDGSMILDLRHFHSIEPIAASAVFPYRYTPGVEEQAQAWVCKAIGRRPATAWAERALRCCRYASTDQRPGPANMRNAQLRSWA